MRLRVYIYKNAGLFVASVAEKIQKRAMKTAKKEYPCHVWLLGLLSETEPTDSDDVKKWAAEMGYTKAELRKARQMLGVITKNNGSKERPATKWFWYLPRDDHD